MQLTDRWITGSLRAAILLISSLVALPAMAQGACPGVCISYAVPAAGLSAVPLSTELTALLALVLGGTGYFFLRRKQNTFLAVALASTLGIFAVAMNARESIALPTYEVVLTSGNYATLTLPGDYSGPVAIRNTQTFTIVITNIVVGAGYVIQPASVLTVGTQIPPGGVISPALIIALAPDTTPPVITLNGASTMNIVQGEPYSDPGATWTDNKDGSGAATVTGSVNTAVVGTYTITYSKTDAAGNVGTPVTRTVNVTLAPDTTPPVITLNGASTMNIVQGGSYSDPGASCVDNRDASCTVVSSGSVNTAVPGIYPINYTATDAAGNAATSVTRTVEVACPPGLVYDSDLGMCI